MCARVYSVAADLYTLQLLLDLRPWEFYRGSGHRGDMSDFGCDCADTPN
jgi:hypothetical protein